MMATGIEGHVQAVDALPRDGVAVATSPLAQTLKTSARLSGIGLHSGQPVTLTIHPAPLGTGILFRRRDLIAGSSAEDQAQHLERVSVKATPSAVTATTLGTVIANRHNVTVSTIEHLMAAFAGAGIDHAIVEVTGPEIPIMDGSADPFLALIDRAGRRPLGTPRRALQLIEPVEVTLGESKISAFPLLAGEPQEPTFDVTVDYADPAIGHQRLRWTTSESAFRRDVAGARTFCLLSDVEAMRAQGLALGGSLENAIVVDDGQVMNEGGLRMEHEFVGHKMLDLVGDLYLLGAPLLARIKADRPGHGINTLFARTVLEKGAARLIAPQDNDGPTRHHN